MLRLGLPERAGGLDRGDGRAWPQAGGVDVGDRRREPAFDPARDALDGQRPARGVEEARGAQLEFRALETFAERPASMAISAPRPLIWRRANSPMIDDRCSSSPRNSSSAKNSQPCRRVIQRRRPVLVRASSGLNDTIVDSMSGSLPILFGLP